MAVVPLGCVFSFLCLLEHDLRRLVRWFDLKLLKHCHLLVLSFLAISPQLRPLLSSPAWYFLPLFLEDISLFLARRAYRLFPSLPDLAVFYIVLCHPENSSQVLLYKAATSPISAPPSPWRPSVAARCKRHT